MAKKQYEPLIKGLKDAGIGFNKDGCPILKYGGGIDAYELDSDDSSEVTSFIWSGTIKASYTGLNKIERVTKHIQDIVAVDQKSAETVVRNLYNSLLAKKYPTLESITVVRERSCNSAKDRGKTPHIGTDSHNDSEWSGMFIRTLPEYLL